MIVLGLHFEHDAGATLMKDGEVAISVEAERVTGKKHDQGLHAVCEAIRVAFGQTGIRAEDVDAIAYADLWDGNIYLSQLDRRPDIQAQTHGPRLAAELGSFADTGFAKLIPPSVFKFRDRIPIFVSCHSINHAACALYMSGFANASGLVIDGYGTCCGMMGYVYRHGELSRIESYRDRFLLGAGYHGIGIIGREIQATEVLDVAGKVMGLYAYGQSISEWKTYFRESFFTSSAETGYDDYMRQSGRYAADTSERFCTTLFPEGLAAGSRTVMDPFYRNLVASMQEAFTEIVRSISADLVAATGEPNVFLSGGCALNILANSAVAALPQVSSVFVPPNASDCGQSMGAAIVAMHAMTGEPLHRPGIPAARRANPFIGARLLDDPSEAALPAGISRSPFDWNESAHLSQLTGCLMRGEIIGLVNGASEIGPRALGNRSIFALASYPNIKDVINHKVKRREWWRPFAPVCRWCDADTYFVSIRASRYMLMNELVQPEWRDKLASITHYDNTCRLQVLRTREDNPHLWDLLTQLAFAGAIPVLLNTSYNLSKKPLVNSTTDALSLLANSEMHGAVVGNSFFRKSLPA